MLEPWQRDEGMQEPHWLDNDQISEDEILDEEELERLYEPCPPKEQLPQWPLCIVAAVVLLIVAVPVLVILL